MSGMRAAGERPAGHAPSSRTRAVKMIKSLSADAAVHARVAAALVEFEFAARARPAALAVAAQHIRQVRAVAMNARRTRAFVNICLALQPDKSQRAAAGVVAAASRKTSAAVRARRGGAAITQHEAQAS